MISPSIDIKNLDPAYWRNLGEIMELFFPHRNAIWVLHDGSKILNVVYNNKIIVFTKDMASIMELFDEYRDADEIRIIDKKSIINYYKLVQFSSFDSLDSDEYITMIKNILFNFKGFDCISRDPDGNMPIDFFSIMREAIHKNLPPDSVVLLEVKDKGNMWFNAVAEFEGYELVTLASYDMFGKTLGGDDSSISKKDICSAAASKFGKDVCYFSFTKRELFKRVKNYLVFRGYKCYE